MFTKLVVAALSLTLGVSGGVWALANNKAENCCAPGAACCSPGSPCCGDAPEAAPADAGKKGDCCPDSACCDGGQCCAGGGK